MKTKTFLLAPFITIISLCSMQLYSQTLGDVNSSGTVDIVDALLVAQYYVGLNPPGFVAANGDVNCSASIDIVDALLVSQLYVGLISSLPGCAGTPTSLPTTPPTTVPTVEPTAAPTPGETEVPQSVEVEIIRSDAPKNDQPTLESGELAELVKGNTAFAMDMYRLVSTSDKNIIFSPYSISVAFAMGYAGARSSTETDIANTMHFTLGQERLHNAMNALAIELAKPGYLSGSSLTGQQMTLNILNSIWGQRNYPFVQAFLDTLAINYGAGLNVLDFKAYPESCRTTINLWVSNNTEQKINELLPAGSIDNTARLVLTNAVYMKASWLEPFKAGDTAPGSFTLLDRTTTTVQMMHSVTEMMGKYVSGEYQVIEIPYFGSKYYMVIILPAAGKFSSFEASLTGDSLAAVLSGYEKKKVTLSMPKFGCEWGGSLRSVLINLGMTAPFTSADFSGIATDTGEPPLVLSDAYHNAFINVNEEGTEAAAATGAIYSTPSAPVPMTMIIDKPFIFLIKEQTTKTILFAGRVIKP